MSDNINKPVKKVQEVISLPVRFNKENLVRTKSIVGRGQFTISYMLGKIELDANHVHLNLKRHHPHKSPPVLIKSVNINDNERCFKALRREINILEDLRPHRHILNLVGACTTEIRNRELYLVFEFCGNGNLLKFIRHCNPSSEFEFDSIRSTVTHTERGPVLTLTRYRLLQWCHEIAAGMTYLASKQICHNDLAARNILVTNQWNMKICNFALAQKQQGQVNQPPPHNLPMDVLPIKWSAPEVIRHLKYSEKSDVWSFSILMWEICSLGEVPYRDWIVDKDFWRRYLAKSERLHKPRFATAEMWTIMSSCWEYLPHSRPNFSAVTKLLKQLIQMKEGRNTGQGTETQGTLNRTVNIQKLRTYNISSQ